MTPWSHVSRARGRSEHLEPLSNCCTGFFTCRTSPRSALDRIAGRSSDHWRLQQLLDAGDIESHPGPPRKRPAPSQDLLQADILPSSAARYASALLKFEQFLAVRDIKSVSELAKAGLLCLVDWTVRYLRASFHGGCLSASQVGTLLAALRRYVTLVRTLGGDLPDPTSHFFRALETSQVMGPRYPV